MIHYYLELYNIISIKQNTFLRHNERKYNKSNKLFLFQLQLFWYDDSMLI